MCFGKFILLLSLLFSFGGFFSLLVYLAFFRLFTYFVVFRCFSFIYVFRCFLSIVRFQKVKTWQVPQKKIKGKLSLGKCAFESFQNKVAHLQ